MMLTEIQINVMFDLNIFTFGELWRKTWSRNFSKNIVWAVCTSGSWHTNLFVYYICYVLRSCLLFTQFHVEVYSVNYYSFNVRCMLLIFWCDCWCCHWIYEIVTYWKIWFAYYYRRIWRPSVRFNTYLLLFYYFIFSVKKETHSDNHTFVHTLISIKAFKSELPLLATSHSKNLKYMNVC